jgi:hypothetical protein
MVELRTAGRPRFTAKFSGEKSTLGAPKQVFRFADRDVIGCTWECISCGGGAEALLRPLMLQGEMVDPPVPDASAARERVRECLEKLPPHLLSLDETDKPWKIELSEELLEVNRKLREHHLAGGV